jgi:RNA polymerase sigma-70 factor (ECF subfamily)
VRHFATDAELMDAVRAGDPSAIGVLFDRHHARLFAFFARLTGRRDASEDLVQETFVRILKYSPGFRGDGELVVWMYRIARNVFADSWRDRRPAEPLDEERADPGSTALERLERDEELGLLERALAELPAGERELLVLCRFEGLRYDEIGELLGCSAGAAKVRAHRALARLRDRYFALRGDDA